MTDLEVQSGEVRNHVFPLAKAVRTSKNEFSYRNLVGTGFLIGKRGFAITAAHVIDQLYTGKKSELDVIVGAFRKETHWMGVEITEFEKHPSEDVGILKMQLPMLYRKSFLAVTDAPQYASGQYFCWGYPHEVAKELKQLDPSAMDRPELIYTQGYIRRRISRELYPTMIYQGTQFYELSEIIGGGASGGPVILNSQPAAQIWQVIGVYIGEKAKGNISYAVRAEAFADWSPAVLGNSIAEERSDRA